ncbi:MAG: hypothetical protein KGI79_01580 [Patescibacteria group bacterium]|nr:hypothetical protein [Patescibacteria group bacterium]MDE2116547.1 hypothetical protein [Patescibacteria group bacterium]
MHHSEIHSLFGNKAYIQTIGRDAFDAGRHFQATGSADVPVRIARVDDTVSIFPGHVEHDVPPTTIQLTELVGGSHLSVYPTDESIRAEIGEPDVPIYLAQFYQFLRTASSARWYTCYAFDKNKILRRLSAHWFSAFGPHDAGWHIWAGMTGHPEELCNGGSVLSQPF